MPQGNVDISTTMNVRPSIQALNSLKGAIKKMFTPTDFKGLEQSIKATTKELQATQKELEKANQLKDDLANGTKVTSTIKATQAELKQAEKQAVAAQKELHKFTSSDKDFKKFTDINLKIDENISKYQELHNEIERYVNGEIVPKSVIEAEKDIEKYKRQIAEIQPMYEKLEQQAITAEERWAKSRQNAVKMFQDISRTATEKAVGENTVEYAPGMFITPEQNTELNKAQAGMRALQTQAENARTAFVDFDNEFTHLFEVAKVMLPQTEQYLARVKLDPKQLTEVRELDLQIGELYKEYKKLSEEADSFEDVNAEWIRLASATREANAEVARLNEQLQADKSTAIEEVGQQAQELETKAVELQEQIQELEEEASSGGNLANYFQKAKDSAGKFVNRIKNMAIRSLFFATFGKAIRAFIQYIGKAIEADEKLNKSVGQLKAQLAIAFQLIWSVVKPILEKIIAFIFRVIQVINKLLSLLTGKSVEAAKDAAQALDAYGESAEGAGKAADKSLASFDELNQLGNDDKGGGGAEAGGIPLDWDFDPLVQKFGKLEAILGAFLLVLGAILLFSGANIPLGLGLMAAGALLLVAAIKDNWEYLKPIFEKVLKILFAVVSTALLIIGAILTFTGANIPLGLGLMVIGAVGLASIIKENWGAIKDKLQGSAGLVMGIISGILLVIGLVLAFSGAALPLGIGLIVVGAVGLATAVAANWDTIKEKLQGPLGKIMAIIGGALIVLGIILLFTGAGIPLGLGLIIAGAGSLAAVVAANWDTVVKKVQEVWQAIKNFWNAHIAKVFTFGWWKEKFDAIVQGMKNRINAVIEIVERAINWIVDQLNKISFDVPDWVPGIGGKSFGFNIPHAVLPRLAQGAVIPANKEFLAVLGDQRHGTNVEAPLDTIKQAVAEVLAQTGGGAQTIKIEFGGNMAQLVREMKPYIDKESVRSGKVSIATSGMGV